MTTTTATTASPATTHTHMTTCANCGETVERQYTEAQKRTRALYSPRTREHADHLGVLNPTGCWVHLQTGEVVC